MTLAEFTFWLILSLTAASFLAASLAKTMIRLIWQQTISAVLLGVCLVFAWLIGLIVAGPLIVHVQSLSAVPGWGIFFVLHGVAAAIALHAHRARIPASWLATGIAAVDTALASVAVSMIVR